MREEQDALGEDFGEKTREVLKKVINACFEGEDPAVVTPTVEKCITELAKVSHADTLTQKAIISYPPAGRVLKHLEEMYKRHPGIKLRPEDASQTDYFLLETGGYFKFKMEYDDPVWASVQPGMLADCWTQTGPNNRDELIGASFHYAQLWIKFRNRETRYIDDETLHVLGAMFKSISKVG